MKNINFGKSEDTSNQEKPVISTNPNVEQPVEEKDNSKKPKIRKKNKIVTESRDKKKKRNTIFVCGIVGIIISIIAFFFLTYTEQLIAGEEQISKTVYVAKDVIPEGTQLTADMFKKKNIIVENVPSNVKTDVSDIEDYYAEVEFGSGAILTDSNITFRNDLEQGTRLIGLSMDNLAGAVNGILRTSDFVNVYIVTDDQGNTTTFNTGVQQSVSGSEVVDENGVSLNGDTVEDMIQDGLDQMSSAAPGQATEIKSGNKTFVITKMLSDVYVSSVFDSDGKVIKNGDTESIASRFNIVVPEDIEEQFLAALYKGQVYITINASK